MGWDWIVPLFMLIIIISFIASFWAMFNISGLVYALRSTRRVRTEQDPRDHYDRWVYNHRRSGAENKPRGLNWLWSTGDSFVPRKRVGRILSIEPWKSYFILFVKSRRWRWSVPYVIKQDLCRDVNRRNLWVDCRGFSGTGPIRIPIPLEGVASPEEHTIEHMEGFRSSFEAQVHMDIMEDMAWDIANAMAPPMKDRTRAAEVEVPQMTDREAVDEEKATGMIS